MNGQILLKRFRIDHKVLVKQVDKMESIESDGNELRGMMDLLPKDNESSALRSHLPPPGTPQSKIEESIGMLNECEQYMAVMLDIPDAKAKFECMIFRADFEDNADIISGGTKMLNEATKCMRDSDRFKRLLSIALKLGNALNDGGANEKATAITLESLLKLADVSFIESFMIYSDALFSL